MATFGQGLEGELKTISVSTNNTAGVFTDAYTCPANRQALILSASYNGGATANVRSLQIISDTSGTTTTPKTLISGSGDLDRYSAFSVDPNATSADLTARSLMPGDKVQYSLNDPGPSPTLLVYIFEYF